MKEFIVNKEESNNRIDSYLSQKSQDISRVTIQRLIEQGKILVNYKYEASAKSWGYGFIGDGIISGIIVMTWRSVWV